MPEFKRNFTKGRMNKDLDERMVPNGEYRDALNVEVATSEGSDVGTVQTLKGNTSITSLFGGTASCVGTIADEKNNKIYWFVQDGLTKNPDASVVYSQAEQDASGTVSVVHDVFSDYIMEHDEAKLETNYVVVEHWKIKTTITNDSHGTGDHLHISDFGYPGDIRYAGIQVGMEVFVNNMTTTVTKIEPDNTGDWNGWRVYIKHNSLDTGFSGLGTITAGTTVTFSVPYKKRALGFRFFATQNPGKIITGINIIDDLLFWTDSLTEPKKINIKRCIYGSQQLDPNYQSTANITAGVFPYKNGTRAFPTLLVVNGEQPTHANGRLGSSSVYSSVLTHTFLSYLHTTVIKKSPIDPLILTMSNTTKPDQAPEDGLVIVDTEVTVGGDFFFNTSGDRLGNGDPAGTALTFNPGLDWAVDDIIEWFAEDDDAGFQDEPIAVLVVESVLNGNTFTFIIQSISNILIKPYRDFRARLQQDDPLFEFKFPRFAYRWKYEDGEYSCYSPFSDVAFLPDEFDYLPKKGHNLGMTNNLRYLVLSGFKSKTMPLDVVAVDILYKESNSPNVYTVDTIKSPSVAVGYLGTDNFDAADANAWFGKIKYGGGPPQEIPTTLNTSSQLVGVSALTGGNTGDFYTLEDRFSDINMKVGDVITLGTLGNIGTGTLKVSGMQDTFIQVNSIDVAVSQVSITSTDALGVVTDITGSAGTWLTAGNLFRLHRNIAVKPAVFVGDPIGSFQIKTDMIYATVPSNQLLRPYDNVPRSALSQEITGNRVVYGNYVQNYNLVDSNNKLTKVSFNSSLHNRSNVRQNVRYDDRTALVNQNDGSTLGAYDPANQITLVASKPERSLKSLRDYQLGVVYMDEFGRQTPIQTHGDAVRRIPKLYANKYNSLRVRLDPDESTFPEWATHFKFYIKENANEYYNLAMDRFYNAEDGNIWLSFPSSERNKVDEETFLILKKQHDNDIFVSEPARYKILAISNEAPLFVKTKMDSFGIVTPVFPSNGFPKVEGMFLDLSSSLFTNTSLEDALNADKERVVRVSFGNNKSRWYDVVSITTSGSHRRVTVSKPFGVDVAFTTDDNTNTGNYVGGVSVELAKKEIKNLPEFSGRFFVKIHKDGTFVKNITSKAPDRHFTATNSFRVANLTNHAPGGNIEDGDGQAFWAGHRSSYLGGSTSWSGMPGGHFFVDKVPGVGVHQSDNGPGGGSWQNGDGVGYTEYGSGNAWLGNDTQASLDISYHNFHEPKGVSAHDLTPWHISSTESQGGSAISSASKEIGRLLRSSGTLFRFKGDSTIYKITACRNHSVENYDHSPGYGGGYKLSTNHREKFRVEFTPKIGLGNNFFDAVGQPCSDYNPFSDGIPGDTSVTNNWKSDWESSNNTNNHKRTIEFVEEFAADDSYTSDNPAIWETEPKENVDVDLYNEASAALPIEKEFDTYKNEVYTSARHTSYNALDYYNCFSFNNGVESNRIRDDFNTVTIDKGPKVSTVLAEQYKEEHRKSGLIYSGIFNSTSGVNSLNQFIQAEKITKDINPTYGSIQKLYSRDTNLITFCEDRIIKVLANKDALFNADGNSNVTSTNNVLGSATPYAGDYGISTDPGSFAVDQYRIYFTDKSRGAVLRLSQDGLTPISDIGMRDYFKDVLQQNLIDLNGSYDENKKEYNLSIVSGIAAPTSVVSSVGTAPTGNAIATGFGCNDPLAANYDPLAAFDDGTCVYYCTQLDRLELSEIDDLADNNLSYSSSSSSGFSSFPNNEFAIQTFIGSNSPNRGIDSDMRQVVFNMSLFAAGTEDRTTLRIRHINLDDFYGQQTFFNTWKGYIDAAIATGILSVSQELELLDPSKPNNFGHANTTGGPPGQNDFEYARGSGGYNITLMHVNNVIVKAFENKYGQGSACSIWANENEQPTGNCDRTFSTPCADESTNVSVPVPVPVVSSSNSASGTGFVEITASFSEDTKGWTSFKSWLQQSGVSINDKYFTFSGGDLFQHHSNETRNNFYGIQHFSTLCLLFNDMPSSVKSFSSLSYEGSQSQVELNLTDREYYNNIAQAGWFAESIITDLETGQIPEFKEKEGKWFNFIRGNKVNNLANLDVKQFSTQGIGRLSAISVTVPAPSEKYSLTVQDVGDID